MRKKIRYRGVQVMLPENISLRLVKKFVNKYPSGDYSITVQDVMDFISEEVYYNITSGKYQTEKK